VVSVVSKNETGGDSVEFGVMGLYHEHGNELLRSTGVQK